MYLSLQVEIDVGREDQYNEAALYHKGHLKTAMLLSYCSGPAAVSCWERGEWEMMRSNFLLRTGPRRFTSPLLTSQWTHVKLIRSNVAP